MVVLWLEVEEGTRTGKWVVVDRLVTVGGRVFVVVTSPYVPDVMADAHGAGHEGIQMMLHRIQANFFIPSARSIVPLDVLSAVWADISMDFVEGFSKEHGKSEILTVVDRLSKYAHFIPLDHPYTVTMVARAFFTDIVCLHGLSASIVSDRDPTFTSAF
jgi:hypothetical protein